MQVVVITGSTRGIGFGLAREFLKRGCRVVVSSRTPGAVERAVAQLAQEFDPARVFGASCDVIQYEQVQALWDETVAKFERVDIWINNAGIAHPDIPLWELPNDVIRNTVDTNLLGIVYGTKVALVGMLKQGEGALYNMEGFGSTGRTRKGMSVYGSTKAAVHYFTRALLKDTQGTRVLVGSLSPGMVVTDLLTDQYKGREDRALQARAAFNMLGDRVETVTPWLVQQMLENRKTGARFQWLTTPRLFARLLGARFIKRNLFDASEG